MKIKRKSALLTKEKDLVETDVEVIKDIGADDSLYIIDEECVGDSTDEENKEFTLNDESKYHNVDIDDAADDCILKETLTNISKLTMESCTKAIESALLVIRSRDPNNDSGQSLLKSQFKSNFRHFTKLSQSVYWADKILINSDNKSEIFDYLNEAMFPAKEFMIDISKTGKKLEILGCLSSVSVALPTQVQLKHDLLPPLSSLLVPNPVVEQHGTFINVGTYIKRMCWAPMNPELHSDQFLAVSVYKELSERCNAYDCGTGSGEMIQIYNCGQLCLSTKQAAPSRLEMVLTHNWGKVNDICWSPQPIPAVCRTQQLIGHLALCCGDGFIRIIPIGKLKNPGCLVSLSNNHTVVCLGSMRSRDGRSIFPTTMHWRQEFPDRIVAGYNNGLVAVFVLESCVFSSRAKIDGINIYLKPSIIRRIFDGPCKSLQISPFSWQRVLCSSTIMPHAVIVDFDQPTERNFPSPVDLEATVGSRLIWPVPGDVVVLSSGKHIGNNPGLLLCAAQLPARRARKLHQPHISSIDVCQSLNIIPIGTRTGELSLFSLNTNQVNHLLKSRSRRDECRDGPMKSKFYFQYCLIPQDDIESPPIIKSEYRTPSTMCACPPNLKCVHRLMSKYSISITKKPYEGTHDWQFESMLNINEIATNPNPASCTWIAVGLECGLINLVPLTHFYRSEFDELSTGSSCNHLDNAANQLFDELLLPKTLLFKAKLGRPRKSNPARKKSLQIQLKKELLTDCSSKLINESINTTEQPNPSIDINNSMKTKTTLITDYFTNSSSIKLNHCMKSNEINQDNQLLLPISDMKPIDKKIKNKKNNPKTPKNKDLQGKSIKTSKKQVINEMELSESISNLHQEPLESSFITPIEKVKKSRNKDSKDKSLKTAKKRVINEVEMSESINNIHQEPLESSFISPIEKVKKSKKSLQCDNISNDKSVDNLNSSIVSRLRSFDSNKSISFTEFVSFAQLNHESMFSTPKKMPSPKKSSRKSNSINNISEINNHQQSIRGEENSFRKRLRSYDNDLSSGKENAIDDNHQSMNHQRVTRSRSISINSLAHDISTHDQSQLRETTPSPVKLKLIKPKNNKSIKNHEIQNSSSTEIVGDDKDEEGIFKTTATDPVSIDGRSKKKSSKRNKIGQKKTVRKLKRKITEHSDNIESVNSSKRSRKSYPRSAKKVETNDSFDSSHSPSFNEDRDDSIDMDFVSAHNESKCIPNESVCQHDKNKHVSLETDKYSIRAENPTLQLSLNVRPLKRILNTDIDCDENEMEFIHTTIPSVLEKSIKYPPNTTDLLGEHSADINMFPTTVAKEYSKKSSAKMDLSNDNPVQSGCHNNIQEFSERSEISFGPFRPGPISQSTPKNPTRQERDGNVPIDRRHKKSTSAKPKPVKQRTPKKARSKSDLVDQEKLQRLQNIFSIKRRELFDSQSIKIDTKKDEKPSCSQHVKPGWWGSDNADTKNKETDLDINKIDDISLGATIGSPKKRPSSNTFVEDRMDKIKKVINRGLTQSVIDINTVNDDCPELLQPFRPLKASKSVNNSQSNCS